MNRIGKISITATLLLIAVVFSVTVWPTRYRYDHVKRGDSTFPVRSDRFTGKSEIMRGNSDWKSLGEETQGSKKLLTEELGKIDGRMTLEQSGWLKAQLYNGTDKRLSSVTVEVSVFQFDPSKVTQSTETSTITWEELQDSFFQPQTKDPIRANPTGNLLFQRKIKLTSYLGGHPLGSSEFIGNSGLTLNKNQWSSWRIIEADYE